MSKAILLSIKPEWLAKILNGEKTIEIRKLFPKDYVGWVYLYCSKDTSHSSFLAIAHNLPGFRSGYCGLFYNELKDKHEYDGCYTELNGKVVARFWCDRVETIKPEIWTPKLEQEILKGSCLTEDELFKYISKNNGEADNPFFAIHISKLEIFDKPRELREFKRYGFYENCIKSQSGYYYSTKECANYYSIKKAPQNYCYIEGEQL